MDVEPPEILRTPLVVPKKLLMGPGPSNCSQRVLNALSLPVLGYKQPECFKIMDDIKDGIKYIFQTKNDLTLALSAAGHGGMEAVLCNLLEPGDKVLVAVNGIWGERACNMAFRYGAVVERIITDPGNNFTLEQFEEAVAKHRPVLLFVVQGESSTGVYQPLDGLGLICHKYDCLLAVDTVASLGGVPVYVDRWEIDAIYTGSQKVIGASPGITPISFSPRAEKKIFNRKVPVKVFYWDMTGLCDYWGCYGRPRTAHHTVSTTLLYGLREGLAFVANEGIENVINRHQHCAHRLYKGLKELGLELFVSKHSARLPTVTTIKIPEGIDWTIITKYAMTYYYLEMSGGLGPTANKVFRIGLMGENATKENVDFVLKVFKEALDYAKKNVKNKL